ncbi:NAD(P)/FAD-dependent oxidoreductase [Paenibacillus crassostreae]|uniref:NADH dehydrogenase n=1 Tax=Paenibacillus crassostreae TaxID=1763538 RepID=A0A167GQL1_9BACL|nr:FAD-dependent oxidoreductase [Paenibacillus crassostreae]AOZ92003.1 FAD-dependent oxidoreductase [Paenibacillus crassostreae]OAB77810.1 NADH dehydrogenase [Paenibacillus crassostreae]
MRKLVILGGGYGGLAIIQGLLDHQLPEDIELILLDRMPFQGLKTEFYALAAGTVADLDLRVSFPKHPQLTIKYGEVTSIDLEGKKVHLALAEEITYDYLVIALGCTDRYHGVEGADQFTNSIQSFTNTRRTYQRLNDLIPYSQVNIIGGGLSGVELAAELRESRPDLNISILDRHSRVLSTFPSKLSIYVEHWFKAHDVDTRPHVSVARIEDGAIYNGSEIIQSDATIWTAGIQPVLIVQDLQVAKDAGGRIILNSYSQIAEHPEVYVIGDCASLPFAPSAQAAGAQAEQVAAVIHALWRGETPKLHAIHLKGTLGALGKKAGFGLMGKSSVMGRVPRLLKSGVLWMSKRNLG